MPVSVHRQRHHRPHTRDICRATCSGSVVNPPQKADLAAAQGNESQIPRRCPPKLSLKRPVPAGTAASPAAQPPPAPQGWPRSRPQVPAGRSAVCQVPRSRLCHCCEQRRGSATGTASGLARPVCGAGAPDPNGFALHLGKDERRDGGGSRLPLLLFEGDVSVLTGRQELAAGSLCGQEQPGQARTSSLALRTVRKARHEHFSSQLWTPFGEFPACEMLFAFSRGL